MYRPAGFGPPHEAEWRYGEAPQATTQLDGCKIIVWSAPWIGVLVATNGMWVDEKGVPRYGAGAPMCWWAPFYANC